MNVRRALLLATGEQHIGLVLNFGLIAAVSRLLTPGEIGISIVGTGIAAIVLSLRDFATTDFLIQRKELTAEDIRTSFTILLGLSLFIAGALSVISPWIATFYGYEELVHFLQVAALSHVLSTFSLPVMALLRRDMDFSSLACINIGGGVVNAITTILLANLGFSAMSFAYAMLCTSVVTVLLSLLFYQDRSIFKPCLASWREMIVFGGYNGLTNLLNRVYEALPQLFLGRVLPASAVGFYNRANMVCDIPDRLILSGVFAVAFPALATEAREGRCLKKPYLHAVTYITAFHWPALVGVALLAHPIILFILGPQWLSAVPLVQLLAIANLLWFPAILTQPLLVAVGAIHHNLLACLISRPLAAIILCLASLYGVTALAAAQVLALPLQVGVTLYFVRRHVPFEWREMGAAVWRSAVATALGAAGPLLMIALSGFSFGMSIKEAIIGMVLSAVGWAIGLWLTRHPVLAEFHKFAEGVRQSAVWSSLAGGNAFPGSLVVLRAVRATVKRG